MKPVGYAKAAVWQGEAYLEVLLRIRRAARRASWLVVLHSLTKLIHWHRHCQHGFGLSANGSYVLESICFRTYPGYSARLGLERAVNADAAIDMHFTAGSWERRANFHTRAINVSAASSALLLPRRLPRLERDTAVRIFFSSAALD